MFFIFKIYIFAFFNFLEKTSEFFWKFFPILYQVFFALQVFHESNVLSDDHSY